MSCGFLPSRPGRRCCSTQGGEFAFPSIWHSGWPKPRRRCEKRLSPTRSCWPPSNCHCRTATLLIGFSLLRLKSWIWRWSPATTSCWASEPSGPWRTEGASSRFATRDRNGYGGVRPRCRSHSPPRFIDPLRPERSLAPVRPLHELGAFLFVRLDALRQQQLADLQRIRVKRTPRL